ncbi:hypothetical protein ACH5RR_003418 [Cinchona calisaya]|uniref:Uncharacterized protein n=1 Tax=Cinchona calisaya TaxID=153742 RepID=A0ABD3AVG1_9GENT
MDTLVEDFEHTNFKNGVLWNGDLHWISDRQCTLCFDMEKECLKPITPSLPIPLRKWDFRYFGESGWCLFVIEFKDLGGMFFDIFESARDYSNWVLKYHVDLAPLKTLYPSMVDEDDIQPCCNELYKVCIPCFLNDEKERKAKLGISVLRKIILYDINDMTVKEIA